jgi:cysteine desulfurase
MPKTSKIYLDNAATTKIDKKVFEAMEPYLQEDFGNASSLHYFGEKAHEAISKARNQVADFLGCSALEVFFTGSATESDNLAIFGVVRLAKKKGIVKPHIITCSIEHPAVLEPIKHLEKNGEIEATYLPVDKEGIINIHELAENIRENTVLVSIMYANNEIGTIEPIAHIAQLIGNLRNAQSKNLNFKQSQNANFQNSKQYPIFHCDAVQAANYLDCNVEKLGVDLLTLSAHKIYGPKGVGVLYKKNGIDIEPFVLGGHQERGLRAGTENVPAIVGMGAAVEQIQHEKRQAASLLKLRDKLLEGILKTIPHTHLNGSRKNRLPNNVNISFEGAEGESILMALNEKGVAVSTGSACSSGNLTPSHVLMALGIGVERAHSAIRFTLGKYNTEKEIDYVLKVLPDIIYRLRKISGRFS